MDLLAPTLSPTPLTHLPPVKDTTSLVEDVGDFINDSPIEMQPYLRRMNQMLTMKYDQMVQSKDMVSMLLEDEFTQNQNRDHEFVYLDPNAQIPLPAHFLRAVGKSEPARLIKNNRFLQLQEFGKPSFSPEQKGFAIVFEDPNYQPTPQEKEFLRQLTIRIVDKFFFKVGMHSSSGAINLGKWLGLAYQDWFDMDDISWEIRRNGMNTPLGFHLMDPTLIKTIIPKRGSLSKPSYDRFDIINETDMLDKLHNGYGNVFMSAKEAKKDFQEEYVYMLMKNTKRYKKYTRDRMIKAHFFESTDIMKWYRGFSVVEQGIRMIINIINSVTFNASNFSNNRTPLGVLAFLGGMTNKRILADYRRMFYSYMHSPGDKKRFPMFGLPEGGDVKWIPFSNTSKDMEFHLFITLLFTMLCHLSGTAPEEIGLSSHENALRGSQPFDKAPDGIRQISRDKGLNTFLYFITDEFNKTEFLKQITGRSVIARFNGLIVEDKKAKREVQKLRLETTDSMNDIITEEGGDPQTMIMGGRNIYDIKGVNNPAVTTALQAEETRVQQELERKQAAMESYNDQIQNIPPVGEPNDEELVSEYGAPQG